MVIFHQGDSGLADKGIKLFGFRPCWAVDRCGSYSGFGVVLWLSPAQFLPFWPIPRNGLRLRYPTLR